MQRNKTRIRKNDVIKNKDIEFITHIERLTLREVKERGPVTYIDENKKPHAMRLVWNPLLDEFCRPLLNVVPTPGLCKIFIPAGGGNMTYHHLVHDPDKPDGWPLVNSSVLAQAVQNYFKETGVRLLDGRWMRVKDGGWKRELFSGVQEMYHMRLGGNQTGNIQVDFHYPDNECDSDTNQARKQQITSE